MDPWIRVGLLTIGGAFGTNARYWLGAWISNLAGPKFPVSTFVINVLGSFAAGVVAGLLTRVLPHPYWRILILVGFLGGFTTFSAFELESLDLLRRDGWRPASVNLVGSVVAGLLAVYLGAALSGHPAKAPESPRPPLSERSDRAD